MERLDIPFNKPFITGNELEYIKDAANMVRLVVTVSTRN